MILVCGDALVDFVARTDGDRTFFEPFPGGSVLNLAVTMGRLGEDVAFLGGVSRDMFGGMIVDHLGASRVDTGRIERLAGGSTLAFATLIDGKSEYAFFDAQSAMRTWRFQPELLSDLSPEAVHIGSIALISDNGYAQAKRLVEHFERSAVISIDPNCRASLVVDVDSYRVRMKHLFALSDIIRLSDEDLAFLEPGATPGSFANYWIEAGAGLVVVTKGEDGVGLWSKEAVVDLPAASCMVRDTIGAGDSFLGALLSALRRRGFLDKGAISRVDADVLSHVGTYACAAAAITCGRDGANPPWSEELASF